MPDRAASVFGAYLGHAQCLLSARLRYRLNFLVNVVISLAVSLIAPLFQYLLFTQTGGYPGWTLQEIILFQGVLLIFNNLSSLLFSNMKPTLNSSVMRGELDRYFLKPLGPLALLICNGSDITHVFGVAAGVLLTARAASVLRLHPSLAMIALFVLLTALGLLFTLCIEIIYCGILVVTFNLGRVDELFTKLLLFKNYPIEIYPRVVRILFLTVLPFAVCIYMPARALLSSITAETVIVGAVSVCVFFFLVLLFWRACLKKYSSAGG